jgi:hypothetical protein
VRHGRQYPQNFCIHCCVISINEQYRDVHFLKIPLEADHSWRITHPHTNTIADSQIRDSLDEASNLLDYPDTLMAQALVGVLVMLIRLQTLASRSEQSKRHTSLLSCAGIDRATTRLPIVPEGTTYAANAAMGYLDECLSWSDLAMAFGLNDLPGFRAFENCEVYTHDC